MAPHICNPALRRLKQEDPKCEASLGWIESESLSKKKKKKNKLKRIHP
jgi:hypothetical protein